MRIIKSFISKRALNGVMMTRWYKLTKYFSHSAYESEQVGIGVLLEYQKVPVLIELADLSENKTAISFNPFQRQIRSKYHLVFKNKNKVNL